MIIAVDFDGTLCESNWPGIGKPNVLLINQLKQLKENGAQLILWTMREGQILEEAIEWCEGLGLIFDAINDNLKSQQELYGNNPRKIYADVYIDDHNALIKPFIRTNGDDVRAQDDEGLAKFIFYMVDDTLKANKIDHTMDPIFYNNILNWLKEEIKNDPVSIVCEV